jgi:type II secretory pathway pseudopilin PulG
MESRTAKPRVRPRFDDGFTIIEALVAVTILAIGIVLSIRPVMTALQAVSDSRVISVSENLAQAEMEVIHSLNYDQVGLPGRTPEGSLVENREINVSGRRYVLDLDIQYAGSVTGLSVIPQGGDGVEGSFDFGVDYKVVKVTVTADGRESDPIVMETIIAPSRVGQHEGIANAKVHIAAHEPFAVSNFDLPKLKIHAPPAAEIRSGVSADEQSWPAIPPATYTVLVDGGNGWIIHPDDVVSGLDQLVVTVGSIAETTLRVYRPATFELEVLDSISLEPVADASLTLTNLDLETAVAYTPGEYTITGLLPETYGVLVTAPGYLDWSLVSLNIPAAYPDPTHQLTVYMEAITPPTTTTTGASTTTTTGGSTTTTSGGSTTTTSSSTTTTTTTPPANRIAVEFTVVDNRNMVVAGADVEVTHPSDGLFSGITDIFGRITFNLLDGEQYTAVGSTDWGHGPDSDPVDVGGSFDALELSRPSGKGTMTLSGGTDAEFLYRASSSNPWTVMPANYTDQASFVNFGGWFEVAKRCLGNGEVEGTKSVKIASGKNRSASISGWCP